MLTLEVFKAAYAFQFPNYTTVKYFGSNQPLSSRKLESFLDAVGNVHGDTVLTEANAL